MLYLKIGYYLGSNIKIKMISIFFIKCKIFINRTISYEMDPFVSKNMYVKKVCTSENGYLLSKVKKNVNCIMDDFFF